MKLIDRYLNEIGRYLPGKNRDDILAEIRSALMDTLEAKVEGEPTEENIVDLLKEFGEPQKVAAAYSEERQYLIGPELYPLFRMLVGIVLAAVIGAQLLAVGVAAWADNQTSNIVGSLLGILTSVPSALGWLVITFMILQHFGVKPNLNEKPWDPRTLPEIEKDEEIKPAEHIFGIVAGVILMALVAVMPDKLGIYLFPGGRFYPDPILTQNWVWILLALAAGIALNIYLLWLGRWNVYGKVAQMVVDLFSIVVLSVLVNGHNHWLAANGSTGFLAAVEKLSDVTANWQVFGMECFRMAFGVALVVTVVDLILEILRFIRSSRKKNLVPGTLPF